MPLSADNDAVGDDHELRQSPARRHRTRLSQRLYDLDERARAAYDRTSSLRLVVLAAGIVAVVGLLVGLALGHPFMFLLFLMVASVFPLVSIPVVRSRFRRTPSDGADSDRPPAAPSRR